MEETIIWIKGVSVGIIIVIGGLFMFDALFQEADEQQFISSQFNFTEDECVAQYEVSFTINGKQACARYCHTEEVKISEECERTNTMLKIHEKLQNDQEQSYALGWGLGDGYKIDVVNINKTHFAFQYFYEVCAEIYQERIVGDSCRSGDSGALRVIC